MSEQMLAVLTELPRSAFEEEEYFQREVGGCSGPDGVSLCTQVIFKRDGRHVFGSAGGD